LNPRFPILVRNTSEPVAPRVYALYDYGYQAHRDLTDKT
jgi:hypothetical protein